MRKWRERGYVPDSDEEEESKGTSHTDSSTTLEGFLDIDCLANEDDEETVREHQEQFRPSDKNDQEKAAPKSTSGITSHIDLSKEVDKLGDLLLEAEEVASEASTHTLANAVDDNDEIKQDYYPSTKVEQLATGFCEDHSCKVDQCLSSSSTPGRGSSPTIVLSSPLTEPPQSPVLDYEHIWPVTRVEANRPGQVSPSAQALRNLVPPTEKQTELYRSGTSESPIEAPPARALRQRNPIQLHPYAIESEKYKQILKARGLRPLRITQNQDEVGGEYEEDSQEQDSSSREDVHSIGDRGEAQEVVSSPAPIFKRPQEQGELFEEDGNEFPDLDTVLRHPPSGIINHGFKRRKIAHTFSKRDQMPSKGNKTPQQPKALAFEEDKTSREYAFQAIFNIPHSPPLSGRLSPIEDTTASAEGFHDPVMIPPLYLQTPLTSSDSGERRVLIISSDPASDEEEKEIPNVDMSDEADTDDTDDDASVQDTITPEAEENRSMLRVQRKIRGVLPASWLKLDLRTQVKKDLTRSCESVLPTEDDSKKGVARPITRYSYRDTILENEHVSPAEMSDESSADDQNPARTRLSGTRSLVSLEDMELIEIDNSSRFLVNATDIIEDNRIDAILPARERSSKAKRPEERRHPTLDNITKRRVKGDSGLFRKSCSKLPQPKITDHTISKSSLRHRFRKSCPPRLGILDAPLLDEVEKEALPQFVRVAARTARSRFDNGRHSPTRKCLRMATDEDTTDVLETLRIWRTGAITMRNVVSKKKDTTFVRTRRPFDVRSGNEQISATGSLIPKGRPMQRNVPHSRRFEMAPVKSHERTTITHLDHSLRYQTVRPARVQNTTKKVIRSDQWKVGGLRRGHVSISLQNVKSCRPALLETLQGARGHLRSGPATRGQSMTTRRSADTTDNLTPLLDRYLKTSAQNQKSQTPHNHGNIYLDDTRAEVVLAPLEAKKSLLHRTKKRHPFRMNIESPQFRRLSPSKIINGELDVAGCLHSSAIRSCDQSVVTGLERYGTRYTTSFDVTPLPSGSFFHISTFIGSGEFAKTLEIAINRDMDLNCGNTSFNFEDAILQWGPWDDTVSTQLGTLFNYIKQGLNDIGAPATRLNEIEHFIIRYLTEKLSFHDTVDRELFLERCKTLILSLLEELDPAANAMATADLHRRVNVSRELHVRAATFCLVVANQLRQIADHELFSSSFKDGLGSMLLSALRTTLTLALNDNFGELQLFLARAATLSTWHTGVQDKQYRTESLIIAWHVANGAQNLMSAFWQTLDELVLLQSSTNSLDVRSLDVQWYRMYMTLPVFELNVRGVSVPNGLPKPMSENWQTIKRLVSPILDAYIANRRSQGPTFNDYCRALYGRCFHLIKDWNWWRSEMIIGTLFDFFARNDLAHLCNEEVRGSPRFLEHLTSNLSVELEKEDRCFHILLKIIGTGLREMRKIYPDKKIGGFVWRLMPNHGRYHPKEKEIREAELNALQNHHDLLCTLYWASPPGFRPRLSVIRNLVDIETSHREACQINIRAWTNLAHFQLSTSEPASSLKPFSDWHENLLRHMLRQHSLARTEAEAHVVAAYSSGIQVVPQKIVESTIARNQQQTETILMKALVSLHNIIIMVQNLESAMVLLTTSINPIFDLFDAKQPRINGLIIQALDIILAFTNHFQLSSQSSNKKSSEDSQDFEDRSVFDDQDLDNETIERASAHLYDVFYGPLSRLVSNCFGADSAPDDALLSKVLEVWVVMARILTRHGTKTWADYLSPHGHNAWTSLRHTEQWRKYMAEFFAILIEQDSTLYMEHKGFFLSSWIESLVERESLLKFQHHFTTALLNAESQNPLLANPPFWADANTGIFTISLTEFKERRVSLLHCVLSNMRESLDFNSYYDLGNKSSLKREYHDLLRHLMTTMKHNYEELGDASHGTNAYVELVHKVVEYLQQHTTEICAIDHFFTNSIAFPLPSTDPTYVVGRLKSYGLRLQDSRIPKQLSVFIQTVSERAAVDGQQLYLAKQLHEAMSSNIGNRDHSKSTLRSFLIRAIFPAYIELGFSTSCGWLLALPIFHALKETFTNILEDVDGLNTACVNSVTYTVRILLSVLQKSMRSLVGRLEILREPTMLRTLVSYFAMITSILPVLDYLTRLCVRTKICAISVKFFVCFAQYASESLLGNEYVDWSTECDEEMTPSADEYKAIRSFCSRELKAILDKNWISSSGNYYVVKGNSRRAIQVDFSSLGEEKARFMVQIREFYNVLAVMPAFSDDEMTSGISRHLCPVIVDDLFF